LTNTRLAKILPFLDWGRLVNRVTLKDDFLAGLTGAIVVLPQGIAFAMIAGLPPIYGLYTAMITPIVAALFGSSRHLVSGPTTTISIATFATVSALAQPQSDQFIAIALTLTIIVGLIQFLLGVAQLGVLVNLVSRTVVTGYTAGAALLIVTNQVKHVVGMDIPAGTGFFQSWQFVFTHLADTNLTALGLGVLTIIIALLIRRIGSWAPHYLVAMIVGTSLVFFFGQYFSGVTVVGSMPSGLPQFRWPNFDWELWRDLTPGALAVAVLGLIEVVSISRSIAIKSGQRLDSNQEFIGLGLSNIVGGFFSCYAGSGSFTRSGLNYTAGAKTPMAAIFAAVLLMLIVLLVSSWAAYIPMATMGGIIILVAYNLIDREHIRHVLRLSRAETAVMLITMLSCLIFGMVFSIFAGILFSLTFYLARTTRPRMVFLAPRTVNGSERFVNAELHSLDQCPQLHVVRIDGSMFFGAIESIRVLFQKLRQTKKSVLLVGSGINFVDISGTELLSREAQSMKAEGGGLYFTHLKKPVRDMMEKGFKEEIGSDHFFTDYSEAIAHIYPKLDGSICDSCTFRIFNECKVKP